MAEVGPTNVVNPSKINDPLAKHDLEDKCSLELLFARDVVTYVMRRRIPMWDFDERYGGATSPVTSFSFKIRNAIEHYLVKQDINIYFLFAKAFSGLQFNYNAFVHVSNVLVESVFPNVHSPNDLLRLIAVLAQYTTLAYKRGIHMAPYFALVGIQDLLCRYIKAKKLDSLDFFAKLSVHAERLIQETPLVPHELNLM